MGYLNSPNAHSTSQCFDKIGMLTYAKNCQVTPRTPGLQGLFFAEVLSCKRPETHGQDLSLSGQPHLVIVNGCADAVTNRFRSVPSGEVYFCLMNSAAHLPVE